jgi:hypothetical protein
MVAYARERMLPGTAEVTAPDNLRIANPRATQKAAGLSLVGGRVMNWFAWLGLAVVIAAFAAVTGIKPRGTRHVAHTRMMGMARLALVAVVIVFAYLAFRARSGS